MCILFSLSLPLCFSVRGGQKGALDSLELELQVVVSYQIWVIYLLNSNSTHPPIHSF